MTLYSRPTIFRLSASKQAAVRKAVLAQDALVTTYSNKLLKVLQKTMEGALDAAKEGGALPSFNLNGVDDVAEEFLKATLRQAYAHARKQLDADFPIKRMAKPKLNLPPDAYTLPQMFKNRKAWDVILKKNKRYANGIKRAYHDKLKKHFKKVMPQLLDGEITIEEAKEGLEKALKATGPRVNTIFRNETTDYFAEAQIRFFEDEPDMLGFMFDSIKDSASTDICRSRHGMVLKPGSHALLKNRPGCHHNCRSHLIPLADTPENRKLFGEPSRQPENRTLVPLPPGWRTAA